MEFVGQMALLAVVAFIQNMAFTWTSRSRNSGDPDYHRYAAWGSNGVWFLAQLFIFSWLWKPWMENGELWKALVGGLIYIAATTEGSVFMMKVLLGHIKSKWTRWFVEKDKRKVGSDGN